MDATLAWPDLPGTPALPENATKEAAKDTASEARDRLVHQKGAERQDKLAELFDRHHSRLYGLALRMTSDPEDAKDLVQESFLRVARRRARLPSDDSGAEGWLVRTLVNLCRDRYRREAVRRRWSEENRANRSDQIAKSFEGAALARWTVERALRLLSPRKRAVLVLHELEGTSPAEIARMLGLSAATVRWHLAGARRDLARAIGSMPRKAPRQP